MSTDQTQYTIDDIDLMLVRAQRLNLLIDHLIFSKGCPANPRKWLDFAEDVGALNHALNEVLRAARIALNHQVPHEERVPQEQGSSVPSHHRAKPSSTAAEKATA